MTTYPKTPNANDLSKEVKTFIRDYIRSVGQLEVLIILSKNIQKGWTVDSVSQELRTNTEMAKNYLRNLESHGFLVKKKDANDAQFYFLPTNPDHVQLIEKVTESYQIFSTRIIQLIYERPSDELRHFADAFKFRKDD